MSDQRGIFFIGECGHRCPISSTGRDRSLRLRPVYRELAAPGLLDPAVRGRRRDLAPDTITDAGLRDRLAALADRAR